MEYRKVDHKWHVALNRHNTTGNHKSWMYEAKNMAFEIPRLTMLFEMERLGQLPKIHQQCSMSEPEEIKDNHLTCCIGIKCAECPELQALEKAELDPVEIDEIKAWTCAAHIVSKGGDHAGEGYILTESDKMYWENVYKSLSSEQP